MLTAGGSLSMREVIWEEQRKLKVVTISQVDKAIFFFYCTKKKNTGCLLRLLFKQDKNWTEYNCSFFQSSYCLR